MIQDPLTLQLINNWQRDFPLAARPCQIIADEIGVSERDVLAQLQRMKAQGILSRIGAVVRPNTVSVSTLAALRVPPAKLERVAALVSAEPGVNHNYLREDEWNLWFVASAPDREALNELLQTLSRESGCPLLDLPLVRAHHIDLGFGLGKGHCLKRRPLSPLTVETTPEDHALLAALQNGLPLVPRPFAVLAARLGQRETDIIAQITHLLQGGVISRFGLVVRHARLGFRANAMLVWDVPQEDVDALGETFAAQPFVTLCYQRRRARPHWPFNLYCMVHGKERPVVQRQIEQLRQLADGRFHTQKTLFSSRCFKQRGARFSACPHHIREAAHV